MTVAWENGRKENKSEISVILWICSHNRIHEWPQGWTTLCMCVCCFIFWKRFHSRMISWGSFSNSLSKEVSEHPPFHAKKANGLAAATRRKRRMLVGLLSYLKMPRNQNESRKVPIILGKSHCAFRLLSFIFFRLEHGFTDWKWKKKEFKIDRELLIAYFFSVINFKMTQLFFSIGLLKEMNLFRFGRLSYITAE